MTATKHKEYWFKENNGTCLEKCDVRKVMIGSVSCQECSFCIGMSERCEFDGGVDWIKCSRLNEAIKSFEKV